MKYLDLLFDKIDYLFRKGKNADERCYDFFIRSVTFLILALIILCYGSFVHADSSFYITYGVDTSKLTNSSIWLFNYNDALRFTNDYYGENSVNAQVVPNYSHDWVLNIPYDDRLDSSNNYILLFDCNSGNTSWAVAFCIPKSIINSGNAIFEIGDSLTYISDGSYTINYYTYNSQGQIYDSGTYTMLQGLNSWDMNGPYYTKRTVFANFPLYYGDFTVSGFETLKQNNFQDDVNNLYNMNYYSFPDLNLCSSAYISNGIGVVTPVEVESNKNHMSFDNVQIGLSSLQNGQNLDSASVIIGCSVDDWINNNIDYYSVKVTYTIGGKFRTLSKLM